MKQPFLKAYKYRIYPTSEQKVQFEKHFGCTRFIFNWALALQTKAHSETQKLLSKKDIQDQLVAMKKQPEFEWLNEVNSQSLLSGLLHLHTAYNNFFQRLKKGKVEFRKIKGYKPNPDEKRPLSHLVGYPRFKSKKIPQRSYQCPQHATVSFENGLLHLPKIKGIKTVFSRVFNGKIKTVTISKTATGKYYASILVESELELVASTTIQADQTIGIDMGLNHMLIQSDGNKVENPKYLRQAQNRLSIQQKIFARKKKESKNYQRQKLSVAFIHEKVRLQRLDLHHKLTHYLICENQATTYAVEDLGIKNMVRNRKLAKSISDVAWGQFLTILQYKAKWFGKNVLQIGRFVPSSKACSCCGYTMTKLPLSIREWQCLDCETVHDRDLNASLNIRNFALADALGHSAV
ncbi:MULTISPECIES: RNA-guided endonuclease TnpB family protein [Acinetobacter]|uniref:RNA-guided endonuclease TnpB family protein n=1 Tax=Acinetobacter TaxID=469 RepID=UPI0003740381|nr:MULTISPECIES: RNA-guided endonuclease TnpB family protein [Acinetobacter]RXS90690.1 transposase [Acinetobacter junii]